jgi:hypothetical protein
MKIEAKKGLKILLLSEKEYNNLWIKENFKKGLGDIKAYLINFLKDFK